MPARVVRDLFGRSVACLCALQYSDYEDIVLWMNGVGPYHNRQETYAYFSLPLCAGAVKEIAHHHETLGEALQGTELEFSGLAIHFRGSCSAATACIERLSQAEMAFAFGLSLYSCYLQRTGRRQRTVSLS
jgi:hypothetical protein